MGASAVAFSSVPGGASAYGPDVETEELLKPFVRRWKAKVMRDSLAMIRRELRIPDHLRHRQSKRLSSSRPSVRRRVRCNARRGPPASSDPSEPDLAEPCPLRGPNWLAASA
jgi:hypothetical protein